jgi:hypothetical protein
MYKYFIELLGVVVLTYATLLTDGNPFVMGITYFSVYMIGEEAEKVYFNPFFVIANLVLGRTTLGEAWGHILAQALGVLFTLVTFIPTKTFIDAM